MTIRVGVALPAPDTDDAVFAWVLDLPGCHAQGADEAGALAAVPAAVTRYANLLRRHGVGGSILPSGRVEIVERFGGFRLGDYVVDDPVWQGEQGAATAGEVARTAAVLGATRLELLAAAARAGEGKPGDRSVDGMLRHVATGEWWYVSRLEEDPNVLREFRHEEEKDPRRHLALIRAWALDRLAALPALGAIERTHRGERWTPRKVLRRFVYHELDHIRELEARVV